MYMLFLYQKKFYILFITYSAIGILITFLMQYTFSLDQLIIEGYSDQLGQERILEMINQQKNWTWIQYAIIPLILIIKLCLSAIPLFIGALYNNHKLTCRNCLQLVASGEAVFVFSSIVKYTWFSFHQESVTLKYIQFFSPLSLANIFNASELDPWFVYPLQVANLFEVAFWLILSQLIASKININFWKAFEFALSSYGLGLLLWVLFISFLTLSIS